MLIHTDACVKYILLAKTASQLPEKATTVSAGIDFRASIRVEDGENGENRDGLKGKRRSELDKYDHR